MPGAISPARVAAYDPRADAALIERAGQVAAEAHAGQKRDNGDPYITHPLAVAEILADYRLDSASIATALLHDVAEDTKIGLQEIERRFGKEVARLVDGVTKLTRLELQSERTKQAENFRKLVLAMSEDIRVLLVKLADRLHNMRTLHFVPQESPAPEDRARDDGDLRPARRAHRHGRAEDRARDAVLPRARPRRLPDHRRAPHLPARPGRRPDRRDRGRPAARAGQRGGRRGAGADGAREVALFDLAEDARKKVEFEQLSDIMAFRIIVAGQGPPATRRSARCTAPIASSPAASRTTSRTPKPNGYQSLHTGVTVPEKRNAKIEVQIRTREMHEVAEYGVAAHWIYKQGGRGRPRPAQASPG